MADQEMPDATPYLRALVDAGHHDAADVIRTVELESAQREQEAEAAERQRAAAMSPAQRQAEYDQREAQTLLDQLNASLSKGRVSFDGRAAGWF